MKKVSLLLIFLIMNLLVLAQFEEDSANYKRFYYEDGTLLSEGWMKEGKPDGYWKTYHENGNIRSEGNRIQHLLDGIWKFYDDSANMILTVEYSAGKKEGERKSYLEKEIIIERFVNDQKNGLTEIFYKNGNLKKSSEYLNDKKHGLEKEFSKNGIVIALTRYENDIVISREMINRIDENGRKQGLWKFFHENGKIQMEGKYLNDKKHGIFKIYDKKGALVSIEKYQNDEIIKDIPELGDLEKRIDYYDNGKIKIVGTYKDGKAHGLRTHYSEEGNITENYIFWNGKMIAKGDIDKKGQRQGYWKEFYEDGGIKAEGKYMDNKRIGEWKYYHENGNIEQIGSFNEQGNANGEWKWFYPSGKVLRIDQYKNGLLDGYSVEYYENGKILSEGNYIEDEKDGFWYFRNGDAVLQGSYFEDMRSGKWQYFYTKGGQLMFEGSFVDDLPEGKHVYYWENGKIKEEGSFAGYKKQGIWKKFDEHGNLVIIIEYNRGEEINYQ